MSPLLSYLAAQARRRPAATIRFVGSELWRRGRMAMNGARVEPPAGLDCRTILERYSLLLPSPVFEASDSRRSHPGAEARIVAEADSICRREIRIFGQKTIFNGRLDWHADWQAGHRWPLVPARYLHLTGAAPGADIKRPWELARFHHALPLAQAYVLTRQPKYALAFRAHTLDWVERNPYPLGIHWAMPMEAALRAINLITAAALFAGANGIEDDLAEALGRSLYVHGQHIYEHREWNAVARGNHYLSCVAGLCCLGVLFHSTEAGARWLAFGRQALREEMAAQVGADGVAQEGSTGYHLFVTELLLTAAMTVARFDAVAQGRNGEGGALREQLARSWGAAFTEKLEKMFDFVAAQVQGRTTPPVWGDADDGRVLPLCTCSNDSSAHLLAAGRALFDRAGWPEGDVSCSDLSWRIGDLAPTRKPETTDSAYECQGFPDAGFYFFASPRMRGSVRCGPLGINGWANHAHCDQLSFEFCWEGRPLLVDPGTYLYSGDAPARNWFRSTAAHNTPEIEGTEQNRYWNDLLFRMIDDTRSRLLRWHDADSHLEFAGEHVGYQRLAQGITVSRDIRLDRVQNHLDVRDTIFGRGLASIAWRFQFAPTVAMHPLASNPRQPTLGIGGADEDDGLPFHSAWQVGPLILEISSSDAGALQAVMQDGWVASRYGQREPAPALCLTGRFHLPARLRIIFTPPK